MNGFVNIWNDERVYTKDYFLKDVLKFFNHEIFFKTKHNLIPQKICDNLYDDISITKFNDLIIQSFLNISPEIYQGKKRLYVSNIKIKTKSNGARDVRIHDNRNTIKRDSNGNEVLLKGYIFLNSSIKYGSNDFICKDLSIYIDKSIKKYIKNIPIISGYGICIDSFLQLSEHIVEAGIQYILEVDIVYDKNSIMVESLFHEHINTIRTI